MCEAKADKTFIYGAGGHAKVVADILRLNGYEVVGFIDNLNFQRKGEVFYGSAVLGGDRELDSLLQKGINRCIVAFGNNRLRIETANFLTKKEFQIISAIHPTAICAADTIIGEGTVIAAGAVVGPSTKIGKSVIVNTHASLDHECTVFDGAHIGPGAVVAGDVEVGECAWIGAGAVVSDHKKVGSGSIVGAGAVVVKNIPDAVVALGVPARVTRSLSNHDLHLYKPNLES
jgi:sugar O-acyltransferase (sialic acid O-acetyltransferase NeuD family)